MLLKQIAINMKTLLIILLTMLLTFITTAYVFINCCNDLIIIDADIIRFRTKNNEFSFDAIPGKGRGVEMMEAQFEEFLKENPNTTDTVIYRIDYKNYFDICNWIQYKARPEWQYPYLYFWRKF